jgi:hypothetical protein
MPATVWMQATAVTQATTVTTATSNFKDDGNIMTAHNSRKASNSRNESNNRTANTWTPPKAAGWGGGEGWELEGEKRGGRGMLAKTAWREANGSKYNRNITASTAERRPITTRMPEIVETSPKQY